jgi:hypothetical protein
MGGCVLGVAAFLAVGCAGSRPVKTMPEPAAGSPRPTEAPVVAKSATRAPVPEPAAPSVAASPVDVAATPEPVEQAEPGPAPRGAFVPADRIVTEELAIHLDDDAIEDRVLVLDVPEDRKDKGEQRPRTLLILRGVGEGRYVVTARGDRAIMCSICGGGMGDPLVGVEAKRGEVVVEYFGGTRYRWVIFHTFRYREDAGAWVLSHVKSLHFDSTLPEQEPVKTELDATQLGARPLAEFDADEPIAGE